MKKIERNWKNEDIERNLKEILKKNWNFEQIH